MDRFGNYLNIEELPLYTGKEEYRKKIR